MGWYTDQTGQQKFLGGGILPDGRRAPGLFGGGVGAGGIGTSGGYGTRQRVGPNGQMLNFANGPVGAVNSANPYGTVPNNRMADGSLSMGGFSNAANLTGQGPSASYWSPQTLDGSYGPRNSGSDAMAAARAQDAFIAQKQAAGRNQQISRLQNQYNVMAGQGAGSLIYDPRIEEGAVGGGTGGFPGHQAQSNMRANYKWMTGAGGILAKLGAMTGGGGGAAGGFGGMPGNVNQLAAAYQNAQDEAKRANEQRYQDVLGGYQDRYVRNMEDLKGAGRQEARDINQNSNNQAAAIDQDLVDRGISNSTVRGTMMMGNTRERTADLGRLQERLRQQRISNDASLSGDTLGFMERRTDAYPDQRLLAQLAQGMGAAGYGAAVAGLGGFGSPLSYVNPSALGYGMPSGAYGQRAIGAANGQGLGYGRSPEQYARLRAMNSGKGQMSDAELWAAMGGAPAQGFGANIIPNNFLAPGGDMGYWDRISNRDTALLSGGPDYDMDALLAESG